MPRIRIRTSEGERVVGTSNCSVLSVELVAHAQRHTLQLRADAKLLAGDSVLEHYSWAWPELSDTTTIELISEPSASPYAAYDPADALHLPKTAPSIALEQQRAEGIDYQIAERELQEAIKQLEVISRCAAPIAMPEAQEINAHQRSVCCSFCGKSQAEVQKLIAGPAAYICGECLQIAYKMLNE